MENDTLIHADVFESISGEISNIPQGHLCTFLRFQNCNLQNCDLVCPYCDTLNNNFIAESEDKIIEHVMHNYKKTGALCITGGEPMLYSKTIVRILSKIGNYSRFSIFIETNGTLDFRLFINECTLVVDYKLHLPPNNIDLFWYFQLKSTDYIKFIIGSTEELNQAIAVHQKLIKNDCNAQFLYSVKLPKNCKSLTSLYALQAGSASIIKTLQQNKLKGSINVQLHKLLNFK